MFTDLNSTTSKENRQALLERTRRERELRKQQQVDSKAASVIQTFLRARLSVLHARDDSRKAWDISVKQVSKLLGKEDAIGELFLLVRRLLFFYRPNRRQSKSEKQKTDRRRLIALCSIILKATKMKSNYFKGCLLPPQNPDAQPPSSEIEMKVLNSNSRLISSDQWGYQLRALMCVCFDTLSLVDLSGKKSLEKIDKILPGILLRFLMTGVDLNKWNVPIESVRQFHLNFLSKLSKADFFLLIRNTILLLQKNSKSESVSLAVGISKAGLLSHQSQAVAALDVLWVLNIFTIPLLTQHCDVFLDASNAGGFWMRCLSTIHILARQRILDAVKSPEEYGFATSTCWLLGNLVSLGCIHTRTMPPPLLITFTDVLSELLPLCPSKFFSRDDDVSEDRKIQDQLAPLFDSKNFTALFMRLIYFEDELDQKTDLQASPPSSPKRPTYLYKASTGTGELTKMFISHPEFPHHVASVVKFYACALKNVGSHRVALLNALSFTTPILSCLWATMLERIRVPMDGNRKNHQRWSHAIESDPEVSCVFILFLRCYSHALMVIETEEFESQVNPFPILTVRCFSIFIKNFVFKILMNTEHDNSEVLQQSRYVLGHLYARDTRQQFCDENHWLLDKGDMKNWEGEWEKEDANDSNGARQVLQSIPFVIPFHDRVKILRSLVKANRKKYDDSQGYIEMVIRRKNEVYDGFAHMNGLGKRARGLIKVRFVDEYGQEEAGIDLGGVFKEFMEIVAKEVLSTKYGLFDATPSEEFYPHPSAPFVVPEFESTMEFVGRILGKSLYEGILIDVPFASFFLAKMLGQVTTFEELNNLDPELYKNLLFLKHYEGDAEDLALNFTVSQNDFGAQKTIPLIYRGDQIDVTNRNKIQYIFVMTDYRLNKCIKQQSNSFLRGFFDIIDKSWISMFNVPELQMVISGTSDDIDVEDWRKYTEYEAPYWKRHRVIRWFWKSVRNMSRKQKQSLLRFVTSSSRPPLLGFQHLNNPPFTIRAISTGPDDEFSILKLLSLSKKQSKARLPTASTCFNLLKLPSYSNYRELDEKMKTAIQADKGFGLS